MKDSFNKYGRRLTEQEFIAAVAAAYDEKDQSKIETNLMIDHNLGIDYPQDKRELIHAARERAAKKFIFSPVSLLKSVFVDAAMKVGIIKRLPSLSESDISKASLILAREFTREKALETEDIIQFLGEDCAPAVKKLRAF